MSVPASNAEWILCDHTRGVYCMILRNEVPMEYCRMLYEDCYNYCVTQYPITVFGRQTMQPRLNCVFADDGITGMSYSNQRIPAYPWTPYLKWLRDFVNRDGFKSNSCLINGYITPDHTVGFHRDKDLRDGRNMVCTVSIGGSRRFVFREYANHSNKVETYLHNGDVVYFWGNTNELLEHSILKPRKNEDQRPRYSITFRVIDHY
jgi:alkylated DNA repair dioxygenase AlkB